MSHDLAGAVNAALEKGLVRDEHTGTEYRRGYECAVGVVLRALASHREGVGAREAGFCWLAEVEGQRKDGPYYVRDESGGTFGWYTNDPLRARRWYVEAECADWCESANKWLTSKVVARAHGFGLPHPAPAPARGALVHDENVRPGHGIAVDMGHYKPDRATLERCAREAVRLTKANVRPLRDQVFDPGGKWSEMPEAEIINRAVAAATRGA